MDASTILSTILILFLLYVAFKWAEIVVRHKKLWAHFDRTPGNQEDRAKGLGLRIAKLHTWAKNELAGIDDLKPTSNSSNSVPPKFLRIQFFADWIPVATQGLFVLDADIVKDMFNSTSEAAVIKGNSYRLAYPLIGDGILARPMDETWKHQRRLTEHAFRLENLRYSHEHVNRVLARMLDRWTARYEGSLASGNLDSSKLPSDPKQRDAEGWFDVRHEMLRTTMDIICQVGFGRDYEAGVEREFLLQQEKETFTAPSLRAKLEQGGEPLYRTFNEILSKMAGRSRILPIFYRFTDDDTAYRNRFALLDKVVGKMVDERLDKVRKGDRSRDGTLLDAIADVGEDGKPIMSRKQAFDELKTFLFAGHDTTGNALTWAFYHLATSPTLLSALRKEIDALPAQPSYTDLERAPYLNNFIKEVLRLHPSAGFTRMVDSPSGLTLGGVPLPPGSEIFFIPTLVQRQERYFERALEVIPERWEEGSELRMDGRAYFPFSLGPRNCIGMKLAQLELRSILAEVVRKWDLVYDQSQGAPETFLSMTLDPGVVYVKLRPRRE